MYALLLIFVSKMKDVYMKFLLSPICLIIFIILTIFIFSALYFGLELSGSLENPFLSSLYLSISTITTLGYGDVVIKDERLRLITSLQAILGLVLMGMMLNSLWYKYVQTLEKKQKDLYKKEQKKLLKLYMRYFSVVLYKYEIAFSHLTSNTISTKPSYTGDFKLSSLSHMFAPTFSFNDSFNENRLAVYQAARRKLVDEFRYALFNFDLMHMEDVYKSIIIYLCSDELTSVINNLQSYNNDMKKLVCNTIKDMPMDTPPDISLPQYKSNIVTPAIILFKTLKDDYSILSDLKVALEAEGINLTPPEYARSLD